MNTYFKIKGIAFPLVMGSVMPILMPLSKGQPIHFPGILIDVVIFVALAFLIAGLIIDIPKLNHSFMAMLHLDDKENFFTIVIEQIPTAIIFSIIMGLVGLLLHAPTYNSQVFLGFFKGLPMDIIITVIVETILELILIYIVKPLVLKNAKN